jgi:preprotein translocase subunit SecD
MTYRRIWISLTALVMIVSGCSGTHTTASADNTGDVGTSVPSIAISFRPVVGTSVDSGGRPTLDQLGPSSVDGSAIESARAVETGSGQWVVDPVFTADGIRAFNVIAAECFAKTTACPTAQIAVVVDGSVVMAPRINQPSFHADAIEISGSSTQADAESLASRLEAAH